MVIDSRKKMCEHLQKIKACTHFVENMKCLCICGSIVLKMWTHLFLVKSPLFI